MVDIPADTQFPPPPPMRGLTGRYRFRAGWRGVLILEVEYFWTGMPAYSTRVGTEKRWRDADAFDLADPKVRTLIEGGQF